MAPMYFRRAIIRITAVLLLSQISLTGCAPRYRSVQSLIETISPPLDVSVEVRSPAGATWSSLATDDSPKQTANLMAAIQALQEKPDDVNAWIWAGRRLGYLWRMTDAVEVYLQALSRFPNHPALLRHRGHRYISLRRFDDAVRDLRKAARLMKDMPDQVEPDGMPNDRNIPLTTIKFNIGYHLALAHFLRDDFESALIAWDQALEYGKRYDDNIAAVTHWKYVTLQMLNRDVEADRLWKPITPEMDIIENHAYHRLCLMYKGELSPEALASTDDGQPINPATAFGVGAWYFRNGDHKQAEAIFDRVITEGQWPAFGLIAAEIVLPKLGKSRTEVDDRR